MATFMPQNVRETLSPAHSRVLQLFEEDSKCSDWTVVHGLSWATSNPLDAPSIPFLILIPNVGFVVFELENRSLVRTLGGEPDASPLFSAVRGSQKQLATLLGREFPHLRNRLYCIGILAPLMRLYETTDSWEDWQSVDRRPLSDYGIGESILRMCSESALRLELKGAIINPPSAQDCRDAAKVISGLIPAPPGLVA